MPAKRKFNTNHPDPIVCELEVIRQTASYSQNQMADALGVPLRTYQKWIYSVQKPRHATALLAKARALVGPRRGNCWEIIKCGREPGGDKVDSRGPCPAAIDAISSGVNGGHCGGRVCWAISGTFCDAHVESLSPDDLGYQRAGNGRYLDSGDNRLFSGSGADEDPPAVW